MKTLSVLRQRDLQKKRNVEVPDEHAEKRSFMAAIQGVVVGAPQWTKGFVDQSDGSHIKFDAQDAGSSFIS